MKFLVDGCVSGFAVKALRDAGYEVFWVPELGKDPGDEEIIKKAFSEELILITADKDFGELVFVLNLQHPTIIRLVDIPASKHGEVLLKLLETYKDDIEKKALITVDRYRTRVRIL